MSRGASLAALALCLAAFHRGVSGDSAQGRAATPAELLAKLELIEEKFELAGAQHRQEVSRLSAQSARREERIEERIRELEARGRRLHSGGSLQALSYQNGNISAAIGANVQAIGDNAKAIADLQSAADHTWLLLCGALVMFMQAGFAMLEAGSCRAKNVQNILMKNMVDVCIGTLCWYAVGWTLAYGIGDGENHAFANDKQYFGHEFTEASADGTFKTSNTMLNWFFQWAFCSAAATIVSGGVAERVQFPGYLVFTVVMTSWIYPVVIHWTWGYGWLSGGDDYHINSTGFMDFAGSGIVHMCGGVAALVGAAVVGPRTGRFTSKSDDFHPHSLPLIVLGTFILWFGWYGFNCGSTLAMSTAASATMAAQVAMNTTLSAATCGLVVLLLRFAMYRKYDIGGMCNGILAGLVSITAPCGNVESGSAVLIAFVGAFVYQGSSSLLQRLRVDDPIDAFPVHGACGAWGTLAAALFDFGTGTDYFNGWSGWSCVGGAGSCTSGAFSEALVANVVEILAIAGWTAFFSLLVFVPLRVLGVLRADDETQHKGMDGVKHSPSKAYAVS